MGTYIFDSTGGCARCDNMDGEYDEKPERPHPYCDCEIYISDSATECYNLQTARGGVAAEWNMDTDPALVEIEVDFEFDVICHLTGAEHSETVTFTRDVLIPHSDFDNTYDYMDEVAVDLLDAFDQHAEIRAHALCECDEGNINFS